MPIAIYHFNVKVVSRSKGTSCVAKAAYIAGEKLKNERDGKLHDYRRKQEIVHREIMLPDGTPESFRNRASLWNAAEQTETRKNSQTARVVEAALPFELSRADQIDMVRKFIDQCFVSKGMCADFSIHDKGDGNPHVHILLTTRRVDKSGFTKKERAWNDRTLLLEWRRLWADWCNYKLFFVSDARVDHRSYKEQGIDKTPQIHVGAQANAIERKGFQTDKGNHNRRVILANLDREISALETEMQSIHKGKREVKIQIIEETVGCKYSEMVQMIAPADEVRAVAEQLDRANVRYHYVESAATGQAMLHIAKTDAERATKLIQAQSNPPEQRQRGTEHKQHRPRR